MCGPSRNEFGSTAHFARRNVEEKIRNFFLKVMYFILNKLEQVMSDLLKAKKSGFDSTYERRKSN